MSRLDDTLNKFKISKRYNNNRYQAFCPAHEDKNASLSILISDKKILLYCHAGCQVEDILKAAGITYSDLFLDTAPISIYQYRDKDGNLSHEKLKYKTPKGKRFSQRRIEGDAIVENLDGIPRIPYNYPKVLEAQRQGATIIYVEGEKDAETARMLGFVGTTMGGASDWRDEYKHYFKNSNLVIVPDKDDAGNTHADKVTKSLTEVCKSIKVVILPNGKDLTEWTELGNSNLKELIDTSHEIISKKGIPEPIMTVTPSGYIFDWNGLNLKIVIDRLKNEDEAEISCYESDNPFYISGIKLLSISHKMQLARVLKEQRNLDWNRVLNQVATKCLSHIRQGEPVIWLNAEYGKERPEYLLYPLFVKNAANIIYADKSSAKSLFMTFIDLIMTLGLDIAGLSSTQHKVIYLDWENDANITGWQKECLRRGLGIEEWDIPYLRCSRPLSDSIDHIRSKIVEVDANIAIIDSLGMAVGDDLNLTRPAFNFYAALRQLPITPIIIAHTSKDISNKRKTVYGNAYYENEARSVWEVAKEQDYGSSELTITLHHRKAPPFSGYHEPLAWRFLFEGNTTTVSQAIPQLDKRETNDTLSDTAVVLSILSDEQRPLSPKQIEEFTDPHLQNNNVRQALYQLKKSNKVKRNSDGTYVIS